MKMSKELEQLLKDYQNENESAQERSEKTSKQVEELTNELAETKAKLAEAVDKSLENPTDRNVKVEHELRKKVAELELQLQGAQHRKSRAFGFNTSRKKGLAKQAVELARKEAQEYYSKNQPNAAQKVADAKASYLGAFADYHKLGKEAKHFQESIGEQVNDKMENSDFIHTIALHPFYFGGSKQIYGVTEQEVLRALNQGVIRENSVTEGKGRE